MRQLTCHSNCQRVHMEVTERESTKLYGSEPDLKMHIQNRSSFSLERRAPKLPIFSVGFYRAAWNADAV